MPKSHKEAKRLAKAVKRRRLFAEQLRLEAAAVRGAAHTMSVAAAEAENAYAERLDRTADRELATAREEEIEQLALSSRPPYVPPPPIDPEQEARAAKALGVLSTSGSVARIRHMADTYGLGVGVAHGPSELLKMIEDLLDREKMDQPEARADLKFGERISRAERLLFGAPRF